jgi:peptidoglycan hydrolase CwlO-like protein
VPQYSCLGKNTLKDTYDSLILTNEEDSDDSMSQNEDKVTNQIETLLKAAQILQQKKDQLMATSKQTNRLFLFIWRGCVRLW